MNFVKVNEDEASALIRDLQQELQALRGGGGLSPLRPPKEVEELQEQLTRMEEIIQSLQQREVEEKDEFQRRGEQWAARAGGGPGTHERRGRRSRHWDTG